jgi:hypothetical protein
MFYAQKISFKTDTGKEKTLEIITQLDNDIIDLEELYNSVEDYIIKKMFLTLENIIEINFSPSEPISNKSVFVILEYENEVKFIVPLIELGTSLKTVRETYKGKSFKGQKISYVNFIKGPLFR